MNRFASVVAALCFAFSGSAFAFGAIAVDDEVGDSEPGYGFVTGEASQDAAKRAALKECKASGNSNCKVVVWFKKCGAYASSKKTYGYGFGDTKAIAQKNAREMCGSGCKIVVAECE